MKYFRTFLTSLRPAVVLNYGTVLGSKETSLSLRREVSSFEILIPHAFVSRGEEVYNTIALKLPSQEFYAFHTSELS